MNKKYIFESLMISAILVALLAPTVLAIKTDSQTITDPGDHGSYARAYVSATTNQAETIYDYEFWTSSRSAGSASYDGSMYYCWFIDGTYIQGYTAGSGASGSSGIDCSLAATHTSSDFIYGAQEWTCDATASVMV